MKSEFIRIVYETQYEIQKEIFGDNIKYKVKPYTNSNKIIRTEIICEKDINTPLLKCHDYIYDKELKIKFYIYEAVRNTDNTYSYVVELKSEDTEDSIKHRGFLESQILSCEEYKQKIEILNKELEKLKLINSDLEKEASKSWIYRLIRKKV